MKFYLTYIHTYYSFFRHIVEIHEQERKRNGDKKAKGKIQLEETLKEVKTQTLGAILFKIEANGTNKVS